MALASTSTSPAAVSPAAPSAPVKTRLKIVDDIRQTTTILESPRDRSEVFYELGLLVRKVNANRRETMIRASLHLQRDLVVLRWSCPWIVGATLAAELLRVAAPVGQVHEILWPRPSQEPAADRREERASLLEAARQARALLVGMTGHWPGTMSLDAKRILALLDAAITRPDGTSIMARDALPQPTAIAAEQGKKGGAR